MVDTAQYAKDGPYTFCFSNAGLFNPWRVVGLNNLEAEVALHDEIEEMVIVDDRGQGRQADLPTSSPWSAAAIATC